MVAFPCARCPWTLDPESYLVAFQMEDIRQPSAIVGGSFDAGRTVTSLVLGYPVERICRYGLDHRNGHHPDSL